MDSTNNYLYIAYSYGYEENLKEVCDLLSSLRIPYKHYHKGKKYSDSDLLNSSGVVFILSDFEWEHNLDALTMGVKGELCKVLTNKIPIYIAYKRQSDDVLGIYKATITPDTHNKFVTISGIKSTGVSIGSSKEFRFDSKSIDKSTQLFNYNTNNKKNLLLFLI